MNTRTHWRRNKPCLKEDFEEGGINSVGYGFDLREDDNGYYYYLLLSGGGETTSIVFYVDENLTLNKIQYQVSEMGTYRYHTITQDVFVNELWDELYESGVVDMKWQEHFGI